LTADRREGEKPGPLGRDGTDPAPERQRGPDRKELGKPVHSVILELATGSLPLAHVAAGARR
jgi:hypothetical protein